MISVDTNVIVRLLTGDAPSQFKKAKALFAKEIIVVTTSVIIECEWVLRYAYHFKVSEIMNAFQSLFGLANVEPQEPLIVNTAMAWCRSGMDFADAVHLAKSQDSEAFLTFDKKLIKKAAKETTIPVESP